MRLRNIAIFMQKFGLLKIQFTKLFTLIRNSDQILLLLFKMSWDISQLYVHCNTYTHTRTHTHTHARTHTRTHAHTHARTPRTHARTQAHTHAHARTHTHSGMILTEAMTHFLPDKNFYFKNLIR